VVVVVKPRGGDTEALVRQLSEALHYDLREADSLQDVLLASGSCSHNSNPQLISIKEEHVDVSSMDTSDERGLLSAFAMLDPIFILYEGADRDGENSIELNAVREACKYDLWGGNLSQSNFEFTLERLRCLLGRVQGSHHNHNHSHNQGQGHGDGGGARSIEYSEYSGRTMQAGGGEWSHFVSLTFPRVDDAVSLLPTLRQGCDAFELRVDLLADQSAYSIHRQMALLRDTCPLPIVFTVRSQCQIGTFPDDPDRIFALLKEGLRAGAEWVDVEACWADTGDSRDTNTNTNTNTNAMEAFLRLARQGQSSYCRTTLLLGSMHVTTPLLSHAQIRSLYQAASLGGAADAVKVVTGAASLEDCEAVHEVGSRYAREMEEEQRSRGGESEGRLPYIGLCLGAEGEQSRVLNRFLTPVTHPAMPTAAAPGQLAVSELMSRRAKQGLLTGREYFLFGAPISQSLSPAMHNAGYSVLLLPHVYDLQESEDVDSYRSVLAGPAFGGGSVTIPHKEAIIPLVDEVRGAAREIGAINTIVVVEGERVSGTGTGTGTGGSGGDTNRHHEEGIATATRRRLVAYNTDWLGIQRPIRRLLVSRKGPSVWRAGGESPSYGLVMGAGGTARAACYALRDLGLHVLVYNRSPDKGRQLAQQFGGSYVTIEELSDPAGGLHGDGWAGLQVVVSTIPGPAAFSLPALRGGSSRAGVIITHRGITITPSSSSDGSSNAATTSTILGRNRPVVLDAVYKPARTALLVQAMEAGCGVVQGATMLLEQGLEQFELWTGRRAPVQEMRKAVFEGVEALPDN
jgi:pentafunctional AROM polypeptide